MGVAESCGMAFIDAYIQHQVIVLTGRDKRTWKEDRPYL
jgi:hypothetical protein